MTCHMYSNRLARLKIENPFSDEPALVEAADRRRWWVEDREWTEGVLRRNRAEIAWWRWHDVV